MSDQIKHSSLAATGKMNEETTVKIIIVKTKATQVMKIESITIAEETIIRKKTTSFQTSILKY